MCQATVYLAREGGERSEEIMQDVILLETAADGVRLSTFFEEPQMVRTRIGWIGFLKHTITLSSTWMPRQGECGLSRYEN